MSPTVSVAMACFEAEGFVTEAVESILNQTFNDFELVVVDDGSRDATPRILERFARTDARVRVIHHEHQGIVASARAAIEASSGQFIARMDADDVAWPERFAQQVRTLEEDPGLAAVGSWARAIDADGNGMDVITRPAEVLREGFGKSPILNPTAMFRREAYLAVGGYRAAVEIAEDLDLWIRMLERGFSLANLPEVLLDYRIHGGNVSGAAWNGPAARTRVLLSREARRVGIIDPLEDARRQPRGTVPWDWFPRDVRSSIRVDWARALVLKAPSSLTDLERVRLVAELRGAIDDAGNDPALFQPMVALARRSARRGEFFAALSWSVRALRCSPRQAVRWFTRVVCVRLRLLTPL